MSQADLDSIEDYSDDDDDEGYHDEGYDGYRVDYEIPEEAEECSGTAQLEESYGKSQSISES